MSHRFLKTLLFCFSLATGGGLFAGAARANEPPCPEVISESEAIRIAGEYAKLHNYTYVEEPASANWHEASWIIIFLTETGDSKKIVDVGVTLDGRIRKCSNGMNRCAPLPDLSHATCPVAEQDRISKDEAVLIATDYLNRRTIPFVADEVWAVPPKGSNWVVFFALSKAVGDRFMIVVTSEGKISDLTPTRNGK